MRGAPGEPGAMRGPGGGGMRRPPPGGGGIGRPVALGGRRRGDGRGRRRAVPMLPVPRGLGGRGCGPLDRCRRGRRARGQARVGDDAGRAHHAVRGLGGDRRLEVDLGGGCELDVGGPRGRAGGRADGRASGRAGDRGGRDRLDCGATTGSVAGSGAGRVDRTAREGFSAGGASTTGSSTVGSRRSPSASARRRTRSARGSSMLDEWLFTPILRRSHRSSTTWFSTPSSRASS